MHRWILLSLGLLLFSSPVFAQWPALSDRVAVSPTKTKDVAVIVAVEDYLLLPDVPGAVSNANEWEIFFEQMKVPTIHVLANQDATKEEILKFAKQSAEDVGEDGRIWFVFIGHGAPSVDGKDGLLVGMDAQQTVDSLTTRSLSQTRLLEALKADTNEAVVIIDACFSGRSADGEALAAGVQPVIAVDTSKTLGVKSVVLSAAKTTEVAGQLDGASRPAFSYLVLGALRGWADDGDKVVTAKEALAYARRTLRGVKGRQQTPQADGALTLALARGVGESSPKIVQKGIESADACPEGKVRVHGTCKDRSQVNVGGGNDKAAMTLEYLKLRVEFDGSTVRQSGRELEGPQFYNAIDRADLAEKWMGHNPWLWVPGIGLAAGGIALFVAGIVNGTSRDSTGWFIGGSLGGFFTMAGGITMIVFGFITDKHPVSLSKRRSMANEFNKKHRETRGLGPEVDAQNPPVRTKKGMWPFGSLDWETPKVGVTVRF